MDGEVLNIIMSTFEAIAMLICLYIGFGKKIKLNVYDSTFVILYVLILDMCDREEKMIYSMIFMTIWCWMIFKRTIIQSIFRCLMGVVISGIIQITSGLVYQGIIYLVGFRYIDALFLIASIINVIVSFMLYKILVKNIHKVSEVRPSNNHYICVVLLILFLYYMKSELLTYRTVPFVLYMLSFLTIILMEIGIIREERTKIALDKKQTELQMREVYEETFCDLLEEVRRKQHDYKNQISTIYSTHLVAKSLEELISMQREYADVSLNENKLNEVLLGCRSQILAGYIYKKYVNFEREGICLNLNVSVTRKEYKIPIFEIIEILGIIIDNAYEKTIQNIGNEKMIYLNIVDNDLFILETLNVSEYLNYREIENMFKMGYSSKGKNRGIGLYSLKKIVDKYNGNILVENINKENDNWVRMRVIFECV